MPSGNDIRERLEAMDLPPAQVERISYMYGLALQEGADRWNEDQLSEWINVQVRSFGGHPDDTQGDQSFVAVRDMAASAQRRRQAQRNRLYQNRRIDHGPVMDPDLLANTIGAGAWVDREGNYIDPNTGARSEEPFQADANSIWHALKGQVFNMGSLAMPGGATRAQQQSPHYYPTTAYRGAGTVHPSADTMAHRGSTAGAVQVPAGAQPTRPRSFVTPSQALGLLSSMQEDQLVQLQHQLYDAGLYPENSRPRWGVADVATREAFKSLFIEASLTPDKNIAAVLADLALDRLDSSTPPDGSPGAGTGAGETLTAPNAEALRQQIDDMATEILGAKLPEDQRAALVDRLTQRDLASQAASNAATRSSRSIGGPQGSSGTMADVDAFMAALSGQESGGNYGATNAGSGAHGRYQIMPANWPEWSRRAGLGPNAPQTPANQEIVARQVISDYFARYGNWRDVAVAWYAGPGNLNARFSDRPQQGGPSINDYADQVMTRMSQYRRQGMPGQGPGGAPVTEAFDLNAETTAALRAADPAAWHATEWADRAGQFFGALASAVGGAQRA